MSNRFEPSITDLYGNHIPYDRGYGVQTPDIEAGSGRHTNNWNAVMVDSNGASIALWITDFTTSFELAGSTAQSRTTRQFFPHNFTQVTVTIAGQMPNSFQYNRLAAFIRQSHLDALTVKDGNNTATVQLQIRSGGPKHTKHSSKGDHRAHILEGYIKNIKGGAERFKNVPEFTFDFVVAYSQKTGDVGIYEDSKADGSQILPWLDIFKKNNFSGALGGASYLDAQSNHYGTAIPNAADVTREVSNILGNLFDLL